MLSPTFVYFVSCACLSRSAAAVQLAFVRLERAVSSARPPVTLEVFFAGVAYIRRNPIVLGVISLDLFAVLLGGATALLPIFAKDVFDVGPSGLGLLRAAPAVGALIIVVVLTRWSFTQRVGRIMFTAVACFGVATVVFAVSTSFWLSMAALAVLGAADAVSVVIRQTLVQIETPDEMRGRVSAVNSLFVEHVQSARRFPRRHGGGLARRHPGGAGRRHWNPAGGAGLGARLPALSRVDTFHTAKL